jgi:hypothetical protein
MRRAHPYPAPKRPPHREPDRAGRQAFQGRCPAPGVGSASFGRFPRRLRNLAYLPENDVGPRNVIQAQDFLSSKSSLKTDVAAPNLTGKAPKRRFGRLGLASSFRLRGEFAVSRFRPVSDSNCVSVLEPGGLSQRRFPSVGRLAPLDRHDFAKAFRLDAEVARRVSRAGHSVDSILEKNRDRSAHILFVLFTVLPVPCRTHIICEQRPDESHNS